MRFLLVAIVLVLSTGPLAGCAGSKPPPHDAGRADAGRVLPRDASPDRNDAGRPQDAGPDAGPPINADIEVGLGDEPSDEPTSFAAFAEGDTLPIVRGTQGSQHVSFAFRSGTLTTPTFIQLALLRDRDGAQVSAGLNLGVQWLDVEGEDFQQSREALRLLVPRPDCPDEPELQAIGEALTLLVTAQDNEGNRARLERSGVQVDWGPGQEPADPEDPCR